MYSACMYAACNWAHHYSIHVHVRSRLTMTFTSCKYMPPCVWSSSPDLNVYTCTRVLMNPNLILFYWINIWFLSRTSLRSNLYMWTENALKTQRAGKFILPCKIAATAVLLSWWGNFFFLNISPTIDPYLIQNNLNRLTWTLLQYLYCVANTKSQLKGITSLKIVNSCDEGKYNNYKLCTVCSCTHVRVFMCKNRCSVKYKIITVWLVHAYLV